MPDKPQLAFQGFELPEQNWFRLPNSWTDITRDIKSLAELKVVEYVLRHTWGYREFGLAKRISTDEFMNGRRHKDGSRMDRGTGLSKQSVIDGLRKAVADGFLLEETDDSDKARVKKYYSLRMKPSAAGQGAGDNDPNDSFPSGPVKNLDPDVKNLDRGVKNLDRGVKNLDTGGEESRHRSEKDTLDQHLTVTVNGSGETTPKKTTDDAHPVTKLPSLNQPPEKNELLAHDIANALGDSRSLRFYQLVADRVPESTIRHHLSEIKLNGAKHPAKLFNHRIRRYAESRLSSAVNDAFAQSKQAMFDARQKTGS